MVSFMKKTKENIEIVRYTPRYDVGLSEEQIKERHEHGLNNIVKDINKKGYFGIVLKNVFTFFNMIYMFIAVLLAIVGTKPSEYTFLVLVFINTLIGTIQEIRSKMTIDKLSLLSAPEVTVVRESTKVKVKVEDIVLDDIMYLKGLL